MNGLTNHHHTIATCSLTHLYDHFRLNSVTNHLHFQITTSIQVLAACKEEVERRESDQLDIASYCMAGYWLIIYIEADSESWRVSYLSVTLHVLIGRNMYIVAQLAYMCTFPGSGVHKSLGTRLICDTNTWTGLLWSFQNYNLHVERKHF